MSVLLLILGVASALALALLRALAVDEIRGRAQRRIAASVEDTIASLPQELQAEWADEWRAELKAIISMPITAANFARGLRQTASHLVTEPIPVPAAAKTRPQQRAQAMLHRLLSAARHTARPSKTILETFSKDDTRRMTIAVFFIAATIIGAVFFIGKTVGIVGGSGIIGVIGVINIIVGFLGTTTLSFLMRAR